MSWQHFPQEARKDKNQPARDLTKQDVAYFLGQTWKHEFAEDGKSHTFKGSVARHVAIERVLMIGRNFVLKNECMPFHSIIDFALDILLGFNCNFPSRDIAKFSTWSIGVTWKYHL